MSSTAFLLVRLGGIFNSLMVLFHLYLSFAFYKQLSANPLHPLLQMFNISGTVMIAFLAFASLFEARSMLMTRLGRSVLGLSMAIYFGRALGECLLFPKPSPMIMGLCALIGGIYFFAFIKCDPKATT